MKRYLDLIEATLNDVLPRVDERPAQLSEALRYAVEAGGKRLRPVLCLAAAEIVGGTADDAKYPAAAIELLHNYTLIHDDLPAMDNDVERRGKPTVWKKFGEANAILAGDALQALAFRVAARAPRNVCEIVAALGHHALGVVQGQVEDIQAPSTTFHFPLSLFPSPPLLPFIYLHKTADLFMAAATMGAWAGGGTPDHVAKLRDYALHLGLAFQYEDDVLDGDSPLPRAETERRIHDETAQAIAALTHLPGDATFLTALAQKLISRNI